MLPNEGYDEAHFEQHIERWSSLAGNLAFGLNVSASPPCNVQLMAMHAVQAAHHTMQATCKVTCVDWRMKPALPDPHVRAVSSPACHPLVLFSPAAMNHLLQPPT